MKKAIAALFKDTATYLGICLAVLFLFFFYYFAVPDYWFLCSVLTIIIAAVLELIFWSRRKK